MRIGTRGKTGSNGAGLGDSIQQAAEHAARSAAPVIERASTVAHDAVDHALSAADSAAQWLSERSANADAASRRMARQGYDYVAEHPLRSLAIVVAASLIFISLTKK